MFASIRSPIRVSSGVTFPSSPSPAGGGGAVSGVESDLPVESEMEEDGTEPEDEEDDEEHQGHGDDDAGGDGSSDENENDNDNDDNKQAALPHQPTPLQREPSMTGLPAFHRSSTLPRSMGRHQDSLMRTAHHAINSSVIEPSSLSSNARSLLLERQESDSRLRDQSLLESPPPPPPSLPIHNHQPSPQPQPSPSSKRDSRNKRSTSHTTASNDPLHPPPPESLSVFRLTALNQLLQNHARRGNFIMLDLDETLMMTKHQPALLLSSYGVRMFQSYVRSAFTDFATKNRLCRQLEKALKDKVLVESDTAIVVAQLQKAGCWVFGVTAR